MRQTLSYYDKLQQKPQRIKVSPVVTNISKRKKNQQPYYLTACLKDSSTTLIFPPVCGLPRNSTKIVAFQFYEAESYLTAHQPKTHVREGLKTFLGCQLLLTILIDKSPLTVLISYVLLPFDMSTYYMANTFRCLKTLIPPITYPILILMHWYHVKTKHPKKHLHPRTPILPIIWHLPTWPAHYFATSECTSVRLVSFASNDTLELFHCFDLWWAHSTGKIQTNFIAAVFVFKPKPTATTERFNFLI